jgi:hypothetical protein
LAIGGFLGMEIASAARLAAGFGPAFAAVIFLAIHYLMSLLAAAWLEVRAPGYPNPRRAKPCHITLGVE